jgi:signal peptide peptidase SppA
MLPTVFIGSPPVRLPSGQGFTLYATQAAKITMTGSFGCLSFHSSLTSNMFVPVDFKVASNIYRKQWLMESNSAIRLLDLLEQIKAGTATYKKEEPETPQQFFVKAGVISAPNDVYAARNHPGYEGNQVAILPINGALMKEDFCGWFGTASLRNELSKINATDSIQAIVLLIDSPGGTVDGTQALAEAIKASNKETIAVIDGMAASAAYWIASAADRIIATSKTDIIGSIGTMCSFYDRSQYMAENGVILREYYATDSKDKNKMMRKAMDGDGKLLIEEMLNPTNDIFLEAVRTNRGQGLNEKETLTGKTFLAEDALKYGLIDEVSSFDTTISNLLQKNKNSLTMKIGAAFKNLIAFLSIKLSSDTDQVDLTQEQLEKIDAVLPELATAKERITEMEASAATAAETVSQLQGQVTSLTTERDALKAEVERLGKLDAGAFSRSQSEGDKAPDAVTDPAKMSFQEELNNKL